MDCKRKRIAILTCIVWVAVLLFGCQPVEQSILPSPEPTPELGLAKHISTLDQYGLTGEKKEEGLFTCAVYYPLLEHEGMDAVIAEKVNAYLASAKEGVDPSAQLQEGQQPEALLSMDFRSVQAGTEGNIISVRLFGWSRGAGEEHPSFFSECISFDAATGNQLTDGDLFIDGYQDKLRELCAAQLAQAYPEQNFSLDGYSLDGIASKALLTPEGVELHFASNELAQVDLGSISITLLYENLQEILSDGMKYRLSEDYGKPSEEEPSDGLVQSGGRTLDPTKPMIALSFDDGPDSKVTPKLLDLLKQYNQRATFCVVGNRVESRSSVVKRAVEEGHEIGNHTWSHADTNKLDIAGIKEEITKTNDIVRQVSGFEIHYIRPTYGNVNENLKQVSRELGMPMVNWTIDSEDWKSKDPEQIYQRIMSEAKDGRVILCHDIYETTYQAMERVIPDLIAQGYQIVTIGELFSFADSQPVGGQLWRKR